ncbi:hypothetical protein FACS1894139_10110 [Planctomycetales bacterium]|nr:hypothetical protein FACS1894107_01590 [Planctomycetales bacterium]GHS97266.1 hypothetical protein FACS1894108_03360 [Planctomycetales bacterium]GHT05735.1 hypothetical protein FACS1894139_10110 [Planctomycetales bacterium]GHV21131.1 hypothetical protein AGMMS49959_09750 [Planctomycetales bacterium]
MLLSTISRRLFNRPAGALADADGQYRNFTGKIIYGDTVASVRDATFSLEEAKIYWLDGVWLEGLWEDGVWEGGEWVFGFWYYGIWLGGVWHAGYWMDGDWFDGQWEFGVWKSGRRHRSA